MIVADTSPLNYLVLIDAVDVLPALFQEVVIPSAVRNELSAAGASPKLQEWMNSEHLWLKIKKIGKPDPTIRLGAGEVEVISLALKRSAQLVLLDDKPAREAAKRRGLRVLGTLGVLKLAEERSLIDFESALIKLQSTNFRISRKLIWELLGRSRR
ncbi:MAG: hypothetical protein KIS76_13325 [Pyrinomonadaceae bacterium]|nr:hypothetical protein [Pyrinomonadaceae bacterium]